MIKTLFTTSLIVLALSAGTAFAQQRTITAFGLPFTVNDSASQDTLTAFAPRDAMEQRAVPVEGRSHRRAHSDR